MKRTKTIRVAIVEDEALVAQMLCTWLGQRPHLELVGRADDGLKGWQLCMSTRPDVVLLDITMPGMDGLTLAERLLQEMPQIKIIILSARLDPYCLHRMHHLGLPGCVDKSCSPDVVIKAIDDVMSGKTYHSPDFTTAWQQLRMDPTAFFKILSDREIEVLRLLVKGLDLEAIAAQLQITYQTARTHQRNIRNKLDAHSAVDLLRQAMRAGIF